MLQVDTNDVDLAVAGPGDVDNRGLTLHSSILEASLNEGHIETQKPLT